MSDAPQSKGGMARSTALSAQERSRIAREAAKKRWDDARISAVAGSRDRPIRLGGIRVPCYVLEDERRVMTTNGILDVLSIPRGRAMVKGMNRLERFAAQSRLSPFVSRDLLARIADPILFRVGKGTAHGFEADVLIGIAEAVVAADDAGALPRRQAVTAFRCRLITSGLTRIGLMALIDQATGHLWKRDADELRRILTACFLPEHRPWIERVPEDFTAEICRVFGWERGPQNRGPRFAAQLIRKCIYEKMQKPASLAPDENNTARYTLVQSKNDLNFENKNQERVYFDSRILVVWLLLCEATNRAEFKKYLRSPGDVKVGSRFHVWILDPADRDQ